MDYSVKSLDRTQEHITVSNLISQDQIIQLSNVKCTVVEINCGIHTRSTHVQELRISVHKTSDSHPVP